MKKAIIRILIVPSVLFLSALNAGAAENGVSVEYIAHASFRITSPEGRKIIVDPYASNVWIGYDYPENLEADALVITHPHYDHDGGRYRGVAPDWQKSLPVFQQIGEYRIEDIKLTGVPGKHSDPYGKEFGQKNIIWIIEVGGIKIAHLGDNGPLTDQVKRAIGQVDILMLPADGDQHILKNEEVMEFIDAFKPSVQIPMHYCLVELEESGACPGGLLPVINPPVFGAKVIDVGNSVSFTKEDLPESSEYWIFKPSEHIMRPDD